ncbi:MAG: BadF/BadG/BcrA/BcrD ATPase family protein [Verrucomicrobiae bacterium]|nr:BadF/BadG/BcrA/BcrD ATPase family protein [Verrucomicrobiae bacterium]
MSEMRQDLSGAANGSCVLALDSGGTKSEALLLGCDGRVLAHDSYSVPGVSGRSPEAMLRAIEKVLAKYPGDIDTLHLACVGSVLPLGFCLNRIIRKIELSVFDEVKGPLTLVGQDHGMVVLAGTGSFVYARTKDNRTLRLDGMGPSLGDFGSAFHIGSLAIRAATKSTWHPEGKTSLEQSIPRAFGVDSIESMIELVERRPDRSQIAAAAAVVDADAKAGDAVARAILEEAARCISETIQDVVKTLGIAHEDYVMVGTGSVVTHSKIYWEHLCGLVRAFAPNLRPQVCSLPPVMGLALAVLLELNAGDPAALRKRFFDSMAGGKKIQN